MRANNDRVLTRVASEPQRSTALSIDENALAHIMSVLTDMYSDPVLAVIREYPTNARDSHLAAGVDEPIIVTLPTSFSPVYTVQDKGLGLTVDDLINVYSKYGYSTKRDNDVESGMLGLGCKSALTYTDQFTVTAVKDGVRTIAVISRQEDGSATMDITDTSSTDEGNGVTVQIPVDADDVNTFRERAERFFSFWPEGSVLVDGDKPTLERRVQINDDIYLTTGIDADYVVMGEIGYNVGRRFSSGRFSHTGYRVVAHVPMGAVNFPPSREGLMYTDKTNKVLEGIEEAIDSGLEDAITRSVADAADEQEAFLRIKDFRNLTGGDIKWQGKTVPQRISAGEEYWFVYPSRARNMTEQYHAGTPIYLDTIQSAVYILNFDNSTISSTNRRKIEQYVRKNLPEGKVLPSRIVVSNGLIGAPWVSPITFEWNDVKKEKVESYSSGHRNYRSFGGAYEVWNADTDSYEVLDKVEADEAIIFSPAEKFDDGRSKWNARKIQAAFPDAAIVRLNKNRWDKFKREFGEDDVIHAREAAEVHVQRAWDTLSEDEKAAYSLIDNFPLDTLPYSSLAEVDDPIISKGSKEILELIERSHKARQKYTDAQGAWSGLGRGDVPGNKVRELNNRMNRLTSDVKKALDKYPLVEYNGWRFRFTGAHKEYINILYKEKYA